MTSIKEVMHGCIAMLNATKKKISQYHLSTFARQMNNTSLQPTSQDYMLETFNQIMIKEVEVELIVNL